MCPRMMPHQQPTSKCCNKLQVYQKFICPSFKLHCLAQRRCPKLRAIHQSGGFVMKRRVLSLAAWMGMLMLSLVPCAIAQNAVTNWNNIAITAARASKAPGSATPGGASLYVAYMQLGVYNAVNAIDGGFEPYKYSINAPAGSSADAAAIQA